MNFILALALNPILASPWTGITSEQAKARLGPGYAQTATNYLGLPAQQLQKGGLKLLIVSGKVFEFSQRFQSDIDEAKTLGLSLLGLESDKIGTQIEGSDPTFPSFEHAQLGPTGTFRIWKSKAPNEFTAWARTTLGPLLTPDPKTRVMIFDGLRKEFQPKFKNQKLRFEASTLRYSAGNAFVICAPVLENGKPADWKRSIYVKELSPGPFEQQIVAVLTQKGTQFKVIRQVVGATDVPWGPWPKELKLPAGLFWDREIK